MASRRIAAPTPRIQSVSQAAAKECLRILDEAPALETLANYGERLKTGISLVLNAPAIVHSHTGHPSMLGLFFAETPPDNCRAWKASDDSFYDQMACFLHDLGVIVVPDSREPWFKCEAEGGEASCLTDILRAVETAVDLTLEYGEAAAKRHLTR